ncbi:PqqD family protein [Amycolatopsis saalfeldensis]|uniref:Coenzyme PQQ synthesis protein D (PqqD) n=1 Tax=Amycolatopsis saalfeldensis TaxID=394193 RepID=A0A1H8Y8N4_9PSEU|nr:PqqD family protein [Amycolatopsis saalfeldensis]SEP48353.1 Coenzyme PQQ synthesis protein D (PqqD) [Amycolatopsis saalfeldensis]
MKIMRSLLARTAMRGSSCFVVLGSDAFELGPVELEIWQLCDGSRSVADIAEEIGRRFDVAPETAAVDVEEFVNDLINSGLVKSTNN